MLSHFALPANGTRFPFWSDLSAEVKPERGGNRYGEDGDSRRDQARIRPACGSDPAAVDAMS